MKIILSLLILVFAGFGYTSSKDSLRGIKKSFPTQGYQPLYLPNSKYIRLVSAGFDNFVADILWFRTINYFGNQYAMGKDYRWLSHMCELVTNLDRRAIEQFEICGTLTSWMAKDPSASNEILSSAIAQHPNHWRFRYMRGFNYWYFFEDLDRAREDLIIGSKLPDAPPFLSSMASRLIAKTDDPKSAVEFLKNQLSMMKDPKAKEAIADKLKRARLTWHLSELNKVSKIYTTRTGSAPKSMQEMIDYGILKYVPKEPFGGEYVIKDDKVTHTSGEAPLHFKGKSARTGIFKNEFKELNLGNSYKGPAIETSGKTKQEE